MDIFDRIASDFVKEARIPSTKNINRNTGKPWTQKEVDEAYLKWKNQKNLRNSERWLKYEGALQGGKINPVRVKENMDKLEDKLNEKAYSTGDKIKRFFGKKKKVEDVYGLDRSIGGGDGDPKKKQKRQENKDKRRKSKNFGKKKPSRRKDLKQHNKSKQKKASFYRVAGTGLRAVQSILPYASDRQANHFLHALAGEIVEGDILTSRHSKIMGEIEVDLTPQYRGVDPRRNERFEESTVGVRSELVIEVDLTSLERTSKMSLVDLDLSDRRVVSALCDALTKNIENNILVNMNEDQLDIAFGEVRYDVELDLPSFYSIVDMQVSEYDYQVRDIKQKGLSLHIIVDSRVEYGIVVEKEEVDPYKDY